jgi:glucuronate isomerase
MRKFMGEEFLLPTRAARRLYNDYAKDMPIMDFHCHLPVRQIAENASFSGLTEAWLAGDHYKWRAMRSNGVPERLITGDSSEKEKFLAWAAVVPTTIGNPLYHWTHLELKRYFGIEDILLSPSTAETIYERCNALLSLNEYRVRQLLIRMNVKVVCTTDDPVDSLDNHALLASDTSFSVNVVPTFRADAALAIEDAPQWNAWVGKLEKASGIGICGWEDFLQALRERHDAFHKLGCRSSDHGIEEPYTEKCSAQDAQRIFKDLRGGRLAEPADARAFKSALLVEFARMDAEKDWVQQLHLGALRNVNSRFMEAIGPNTGFDTIGDFSLARPLALFFNTLEAEDRLPKTILYCINPADNALIAAIAGCFPKEKVRGRIQFGSAWWFNDQKHGIEEQLHMLTNMGLISRFVGMVTDSRSFLSFPRHEYFRRILCSILGAGMQSGDIPYDFGLVGGVVQDICFRNAVELFAIPTK